MRKYSPYLFYMWPILIIIGELLILQDFSKTDRPEGSAFLVIGLFAIFLYYIFKFFRILWQSRGWNIQMIFCLNVVLMSVVLFTRYKHYPFGDYPTILLVPLFISISIINFKVNRLRGDVRMFVVTILYLLMIVPLWGFNFNRAPRPYFSFLNYDSYEDVKSNAIRINYNYRFKETLTIAEKALHMRDKESYVEAISLFKQAIDLEPKHPKLRFDISECYARIGDFENALIEINNAIDFDLKNPYFYSNRGLIHYKMGYDSLAVTDYLFAINIDSTEATFYYNIALAYNGLKNQDLVCKSIKKAEYLRRDITNDPILKELKQHNCK